MEDSDERTQLVSNFLADCNVPHVHKNIITPLEYRRRKCEKVDAAIGCPPGSIGQYEETWRNPRGVAQRNLAITYILETFAVYLFDIEAFYPDCNSKSLPNSPFSQGKMQWFILLMMIILTAYSYLKFCAKCEGYVVANLCYPNPTLNNTIHTTSSPKPPTGWTCQSRAGWGSSL